MENCLLELAPGFVGKTVRLEAEHLGRLNEGSVYSEPSITLEMLLENLTLEVSLHFSRESSPSEV